MQRRHFNSFAVSAIALNSALSLRGSPVVIETGDSRIEVTIAPGPFDLAQTEIISWISKAAANVAAYYSRFPLKFVRLVVHAAPGERGISHGTTFGWGGAHIRITVGEHTTQRQLDEDWMMTHEFVHLAFPDVAEQHHWIEEGIATYVEPIARAQTGELTDEEVWKSFVRDMPQGEPKAGDRGLDNTHTWGRTYWGGALFCLAAEIRIREATANHMGLQDALRAILEESGGIESHRELVKAFKVGDKATKTEVLARLYAETKDAPVIIDLADLWSRLNIEAGSNRFALLNSMPAAKLRQAITKASGHHPAEDLSVSRSLP